jgi:hypothetical protein
MGYLRFIESSLTGRVKYVIAFHTLQARGFSELVLFLLSRWHVS